MASCGLMTYKFKTSYLLPTQPLNSSEVETGKQPLKTRKRGEQETPCQVKEGETIIRARSEASPADSLTSDLLQG